MQAPLSRHFNAAVVTLSAAVLKKGFDVGPVAPSTLAALQGHYDQTGRVLVWNGASENTIFGDEEINWAFRAWHDAIHLRFSLPFTLEGEKQVAEIMQEQIHAKYGRGVIGRYFSDLIQCEVVGQAEHYGAHGVFPENQSAFARDWLTRKGVVSPFGENLAPSVSFPVALAA